MRSSLWWYVVLTSVVAGLAGCRDEQAGPRAKPNRAQSKPLPSAPVTARAFGLDALPGTLTFTSGGTWANGAVTYLGSIAVPEQPQPGQTVTLRHFFRAGGVQPRGYRFFCHVVDVASGRQVGNLDHELQDGAAPLGSWPTGKVIEDRHQLQMPEGKGPLRLMLGFWDDSGRLPPDPGAPQDDLGRMAGPTLDAARAPLPEYVAVRVDAAPIIDGVLNDESWKAARAAELQTSFDGRPTRRRTFFRLVYDADFIYVGFECEDPDIWGTLRTKDDAIYNEEVVEVFLDADGDGKTYNELQVSPHNVQFDASFVARRSDLETAKRWESGMTTAVQVRGTLDDDRVDLGWSVELKIPIKNLTAVPGLPVKKGDVWRFNAYRLEHLVHGREIEGQAFSPLFVGDFHALPRFGRLRFD
jgi:hypothetical protein